MEARRESACRARHFIVPVSASPKPIVVDEEIAACVREIAKKVNERVAAHV